MNKLLRKFLALIFVLIITVLASCDSGTDSNSYKLYCDKCQQTVAVRLEFYGYKYHNEYGYQVKLWNAYCTKCDTYLGVYSGPM